MLKLKSACFLFCMLFPVSIAVSDEGFGEESAETNSPMIAEGSSEGSSNSRSDAGSESYLGQSDKNSEWINIINDSTESLSSDAVDGNSESDGFDRNSEDDFAPTPRNDDSISIFGGEPVLLDGNSEPIGIVSGFDWEDHRLSMLTLVEVESVVGGRRVTALLAGGDLTDPLRRLETTRVDFEDENCLGQAFIDPSYDTSISGAVFPSGFSGRGNFRKWYVATSTRSQIIRVKSTLSRGRGCSRPERRFGGGYPAQVVEENIFDRFPLPWSLQFR